RYPQPKCHPDTRTEILEHLWNWSSENNATNQVLWLHGPAGSGKSAIAQSFCRKLEEEGCLGASFFFKRGHPSRRNASKLFPTIAYQLSLCAPECKGIILAKEQGLKDTISKTVEDDPSILHRSLSLQLRRLITEPSSRNPRSRPLVIVIDGLDECENQDIQQEILRAIGEALQDQDIFLRIPLRIFIASRPEPHIAEIFRGDPLIGSHFQMNIHQSFDDVRKYL
ncbi:hypothetical protein B0H13DRAFT_2537349, partial [Mycena leptocephala]